FVHQRDDPRHRRRDHSPLLPGILRHIRRPSRPNPPPMNWGVGSVWAVGIPILLFVLHREAIWAEERGWIYYRRWGGGGVSGAMSNGARRVRCRLQPRFRASTRRRAGPTNDHR